MAVEPLWRCPDCGREFANRNQTHACGTWTLERHFDGRDPSVREIVERFIAAAARNGPVTVLPEKTRIALQVRMSFAAMTTARRWVDAHVVLARRVEHPRFRKVTTFSPRNHLHEFRLTTPDEVDGDVATWLAEAYAVGEQRHLRTGPSPS
jgi:hypothetical protein